MNFSTLFLITTVSLSLCGCFGAKKPPTAPKKAKRYKIEQDIGPHRTEKLPDFSKIENAVPKHEPKSKIGNPKKYTVFNKSYEVLPTSKGYKAKGKASWYGKKFHGYHTSNGEVYDMYGMSAAHKTLPLPTYAKVTNLKNGKSVIVKINDRGPFHGDRLIDLSYAAASKLGILANGTADVEIHAIDPTPVKPQLTYIQVGSFNYVTNAKKMAAQIAKINNLKGHKVAVKSGKNKKGTVYHVHIGPIKNETVLTEVTNTLVKKKFPKPIKVRR
jgi:rare lipoprotein A